VDIARSILYRRRVTTREADQIITQNLAPIYEEVADAFASQKDKVVVANVDADGAGRDLGSVYSLNQTVPSISQRLQAEVRCDRLPEYVYILKLQMSMLTSCHSIKMVRWN
jgi:hypothetical protein